MDGATLTTIPHAISVFYDRVFLKREAPYLVHNRYGQTRNIPQNNTATIKFRKYGAIALATTPLTEGLTPEGKNPIVTDITVIALWYGDYMPFTDKVVIESPDKVLAELYKVLGEQGGQTIDVLTRNVLVAGTNVLYGGDATSRDELTTGDVVTTTLLDSAIATLRSSNAMYLTEFVSPQNGYATTPLSPSFIAVVHPQMRATLKALTGWIPVNKYANMSPMLYELGSYDGIRFVESTQGKVFSGEGASSSDVYPILIIAQDAYGVTAINGHSMKTITKTLGSGGASDPLDQRGTVGWKANHVAKILNQSWLLRVEVSIIAS